MLLVSPGMCCWELFIRNVTTEDWQDREKTGWVGRSQSGSNSALPSDGPKGETRIGAHLGLVGPPEGTQPGRRGQGPEFLLEQEGLSMSRPSICGSLIIC